MSTHRILFNVPATRLWSAILLVTVLVVLTAGQVSAQQPSADDVNRVAAQLSCPTCTGINVADCPTETCAQWRAKIGELLAEGKTQQDILDYFAARYGDHVLQTPPARGIFLGVWAVPALAVVAGLAVLIYLTRGWSKRSPVVASPAASEQAREDEYLKRVKQDIKEWKR